MKRLSLTLAAILAATALSLGPPVTGAEPAPKKPTSVHDFKVKTIAGTAYDLKKLAGKVLMVVNVASQ